MADKAEETYKIKRKKDKTNSQTKKESKAKEVALTKAEKKALIEQQKELDAIKEEIKTETKLPQNEVEKIHINILKKMFFATILLAYFICIDIGYLNIKSETFLIVLKVLSMLSIIITVLIYEYAYKKDSDKYAINGIEWMVLSICTVILLHIYKLYNDKFIIMTTIFGLLFMIYYIIKSIVVYIKDKREIRKKIIENNREETR